MELSQFLTYMDRQQANQAILPNGEPPCLLIGEVWISANTRPSETAIEIMLRGAMPPILRPKLDEVNGEIEFDHAALGSAFRIRSRSTRGARTVVITRLDSNGQLLTPWPENRTATPYPEQLQVSIIGGAVPPKHTSMPIPTSVAPLPPTPSREMGQPPLSFDKSFPNVVEASSLSPPPLSSGPPALPKSAVGDDLGTLREALKDVQWYHAVSGTQVGPVKTEVIESLIKSKIIKLDTLVWHEQMPEWMMAKLTDLKPFFPASALDDIFVDHAASQKPLLDDFEVPAPLNRSNDSGTPGAKLPTRLKGFNWGAFWLPGIWLMAHNMAWGAAVMVLGALVGGFFPTYLGTMLVINIAAGMYGNSLAWEHREWKSEEEFKDIQGIWAISGFAADAALFLISFLWEFWRYSYH